MTGMSYFCSCECSTRMRPVWVWSGLLVVLAGFFTDALRAHDFWIEPSAFNAEVGDRIDLVLRVGQDFNGDSQPYITDWFTDYRVQSPDGTHPIEGLMGDDPAGGFSATAPGTHVVGYRSTRDFVSLEPEKFRTYLQAEGLDEIIRLREVRGESDRPAPEYYSRCAKSLIRVGRNSQGYDAVLGYTLELIPERDPASMQPGDKLPLRLVYQSEPIKGVLVIAFTSDNPDEKITSRTDDEGRVRLPLPESGIWLIKAVHMIEVPADNKVAEWESFWASLTFVLPET
jgi:uncharacterized GH25 family protein